MILNLNKKAKEGSNEVTSEHETLACKQSEGIPNKNLLTQVFESSRNSVFSLSFLRPVFFSYSQDAVLIILS